MNALLLHGGGPTAVLNASLAGLALALKVRPGVRLRAARHGVAGLLRREFLSLDGHPADLLRRVGREPGSAIGSSRHTMKPEEFEEALAVLRSESIETVFLAGGNGTMRCALQLARGAGGRLQVIGIPKTIDNDIRGTDHTPGYGSVARFFAHAARDLGADNEALPSPVTVLETLGRDTGWVTAATVLARSRPDDAPHLIYLPERAVPLERIFSDVEDTVRRLGRCVIAVCEGQRDERGGVFGADVQVDRDGIPRLASNLGHTLALLIQQKTGLRTRSEKPGLVGRCFALTTSERDRADAELCGRAAAAAALEGQSEVMVALTSCAGETTLAGLEEAGGGLRNFPQEWMSGDQGEPNEVYRAWAKELAGTVPERARLEDL